MINKYNTAQWPYFSKDMISAVSRVLCSGKVNQWTGNEVRSFEKEYAAYLGLKYTIALANGSVALDVALMALGIGSGDEVIVPSRSFVASASCVALRGATPSSVRLGTILNQKYAFFVTEITQFVQFARPSR